jgi:hypothetical protein
MPLTLFFCVKIASAQPQLTARNCIVLHKKYTVLSGCNVMSCVDFQVWELVPNVKKFKLVVDEILAFPVTTKGGEIHMPCGWNLKVTAETKQIAVR